MFLLTEPIEPGRISTLLTFDPGVAWPDERGIALAEETLDQGCPVILQFARLADASSAHKRLTAAMAH